MNPKLGASSIDTKCRRTDKRHITTLSAKSKSNLMKLYSDAFGTIRGDKVHYPGVTAAFVAHLETIRLQINTAASENVELCTADISDFYLGTPLDRKEYMSISLKHIPSDI